MGFIELIINTIADVTELTPVVKGGNRSNPIEYNVSRMGDRRYRLELDLNGDNLLSLLDLEDTILSAINDFGDGNPLKNGSVENNGGGTFAKDNIITKTMYFDVVDYKTDLDPYPVPKGTKIITENGLYDVKAFANASVNVTGGDVPHYEGTYEVTPRKQEQVLATRNTILDDDVTVFQIPYSAVENPSGGFTVTIGIE